MALRLTRWTVVAGVLACGRPEVPPFVPVPMLPPQNVEVSLYLIGDAGAPDPKGEPVFQALRRDLRERSSRRIVVFLGDNIYPRGLPASGSPDRREAERRLAAQVEVVVGTGASGYFVLGNHDWSRGASDGWAAARRQTAFVDSAGRGALAVEPANGCPGPSVIDVGERLRLILLDTQWWLHTGSKPADRQSSCPADSGQEVVDSIRSALSFGKSRLVVVTAHHPLTSGGVHGGYFGWRDHLFPLEVVAPGLWLPLPFVGSLYPAARQYGVSNQDLESRVYRGLIANLRKAFADHPPELYAAGHEHNLQVIDHGSAPLELVSGGGYFGHTSRVVPVSGTRFARAASGFARLDVPRVGAARLALLQVDRDGRSREVFSMAIKEAGGSSQIPVTGRQSPDAAIPEPGD